MDFQKFIQPVDPEIADTLVRNDDESGWVQTDREGLAHMKVLWTSPQSGGWAVYLRWKKGYVVPPHKHLGAIHAYVISGRMRVRDTILETGDYLYEANGMIHDETEALEDTMHINIADGPLMFFNDEGMTQYLGWEQLERMKAKN